MENLQELIIKNIEPLNSKDKIVVAQDIFLEFTYSHFPVIENNAYIGCITKEDAETLNPISIIGDDKYNFERFYVKNSMPWLDILEEFAKHETNIIPVLDELNNYLGYYELDDFIHIFHETPFLREEGGILVIAKEGNDFSMSQIAQIVESNNAKILGLFISKIENQETEITLKISLGGLNEIIQTFRRFEYRIVSQHQEDSYIENLKERSDYLDKYLNI
uniref:CBS domain-containing protein n=1 Tax=Flavobacterium sp. TaxID=239 RepID=UPI004049AF7A